MSLTVCMGPTVSSAFKVYGPHSALCSQYAISSRAGCAEEPFLSIHQTLPPPFYLDVSKAFRPIGPEWPHDLLRLHTLQRKASPFMLTLTPSRLCNFTPPPGKPVSPGCCHDLATPASTLSPFQCVPYQRDLEHRPKGLLS